MSCKDSRWEQGEILEVALRMTFRYNPHPSSKDLLYVADRDPYRKTQLVKTQRTIGREMTKPIVMLATQSLYQRFKEYGRRGDGMITRAIC